MANYPYYGYYPQQPQIMQQSQMIQQPQQQTNNGLNWVQGEAGARSFLVAPNNSVMLMDSESQTFYIKSADNTGMPLPLRIFDYTERNIGSTTQNSVLNTQPDKVYTDTQLRQEIDELKAKYIELEKLMKGGADDE